MKKIVERTSKDIKDAIHIYQYVFTGEMPEENIKTVCTDGKCMAAYKKLKEFLNSNFIKYSGIVERNFFRSFNMVALSILFGVPITYSIYESKRLFVLAVNNENKTGRLR